MELLKRASVAIVCFVFFFVCCFFSSQAPEMQAASGSVTNISKIIIDAGHGGFDGGAVAADGTLEKDINLLIAQKLAAILRFHGYTVIMTRTEDKGTETDSSAAIADRKKSDMRERLRIMEENPDAIFVSIHLNKFTTSIPTGAQVFYSPNDPESRELGLSLQTTIKRLIQPENERTVKQATKSTYLLYKAALPAVIVECGFLSNKRELELLKTDEYQSKMAFAVFCGIEEYT